MSSQCGFGGHLLGCSVLGHIHLGCSAAGLGAAHEEAGHWAHCACSHPYHVRRCNHISRRPYPFVPMFLSLLWVPASLVDGQQWLGKDCCDSGDLIVFAHLFNCGNQSDWVFCYTEGTPFFLIENSVICRVSDASYMACCSVRTPWPQYWGCTQYCAFLADSVKTCRNVISYILLPFMVSQCITLCFPSSSFALFSTVFSTQRKVSH